MADGKEFKDGSPFDGSRFSNFPEREHPTFYDGLKWQFSRDAGPWDKPRSDITPGPPPPKLVGKGEIRITLVGHATLLVQLDGLNLLTDPIWAERASPVSWAGPKRVRPPGIRFEELPPIHAVLVSHNHYDHLCMETLKRLYDSHQPKYVTGLRNAPVFEQGNIEPVVELDWWQSHTLSKSLDVTYVPSQHFSSRGVFDRNAALWGGFVIRGSGGAVYFAGDTGEGPHFAEIGERVGPIDLALLPIGAFRPRELMRAIHMSPADAVVAYQQLGARKAMAMHYGTFALADDGQEEPLEELDRALKAAGLSREDFWVLEFGAGREVPGP